MGDSISRPSFFEGQILAAADLQSGIDHATGQLARHERYLHSWGIASGLGLEKAPRSTAAPGSVPYVEVTVKAGIAIDGSGREIAVPADFGLSTNDFEQSNVAVGARKDDWFPVFIMGVDQAGAAASGGLIACAAVQSAAIVENFRIDFGRPGDDALLDSQTLPPITDGPGTGGWRVLLGFVQWDGSIAKFHDASLTNLGIGPRYAGVQADEVAARGGHLVLRSAPRTQGGAAAVAINPSDIAFAGEFQFGAQDAAGTVQPVFRVTAKGDVIASGKIQGAALPGSIQVQSGTATDGVILPLPPGVTEDMVTPGKGTLHVQLVPRLGGAQAKTINASLECRLDGDRRVHCLVRQVDLSAAASSDFPGLCDYLLLVAVPAS